MDRVALWKRVAGDTALLAGAARVGAGDVAAMARLRRGHDAEAVRVALRLCEARRKAAVKFAAMADTLVADPAGVEQSTSLAVGRFKASLLRAASGAGAAVLDLCCGIGGDAVAFAQAGLCVRGVDADPLRAWMASQNARCATAVADVATLDVAGRLIHVDPGRRAGGRRLFKLDALRPPPAVLRGLIASSAGAMVKLAPGIDVAQVCAALGEGVDSGTGKRPEESLGGRAVFVSERGRLVQALWLTGALRPEAERTAVMIDGRGDARVLTGDADRPEALPLSGAERFVFTVDPSVERAAVLGCVGLPLLHPQLGLFTAGALAERDALPGDVAAMLTGFELLAELPYREAKVKRWLRDHDGGVVEVKTRDRAVNPDALQGRLRGGGGTAYCVFVLRFDRQVRALVTRRV